MATQTYVTGSARFYFDSTPTNCTISGGTNTNVTKLKVTNGSTTMLSGCGVKVDYKTSSTPATTVSYKIELAQFSGYVTATTTGNVVFNTSNMSITATGAGTISFKFKTDKAAEAELEADDYDDLTLDSHEVTVTIAIEVVSNEGIPELKKYYVIDSYNDLNSKLPTGCSSTTIVTGKDDAGINSAACREVKVYKGTNFATTYIFNTAVNDSSPNGSVNKYVKGNWGTEDDPWFICWASANNKFKLLTMPSSVTGSTVKSLTDVVSVTSPIANGTIKLSISRE